MGGRGREGEPIEWTGWACQLEARDRGKSRCPESVTASTERAARRAEVIGALGRQEKPLAKMSLRPYRKPTQVGREKSPKVDERPSVKELGKLTP